MNTLRNLKRKAAMTVTGLALRHLGPKKLYKGEVEEALAKGHKTSTRRLGLRRHLPWHERFRRRWIRIRREP
jgi:hypothetical protein